MMVETPCLTIERIEDETALVALADTWNRLLAVSATRTAELTYEWQITYWRHFGHNAKLFVLVVKEGQEVIAIAPLKVTRSRLFGMPVQELRFIADRESNYQDFIIGREQQTVLMAIAAYLKTHSQDWDVFYLARIPTASDTCAWFASAFESWGRWRVADIQEVVSLQLNMDWATYSRAMRKRLRCAAKCKRRLESMGMVEHYHCETEVQLAASLESLFAFHRNRWDRTDTPSQFNDPRVCAFYHEVSPALLAKGELDLFVLTVQQRPAAVLYAFVFDAVALLQLEAYDRHFSHGSPGIVCLDAFVGNRFCSGLEAIDLGSYFPYKEGWFNQVATRHNFELYAADRFCARYGYIVRQIANSSHITPATNLIRLARQKLKGWLWKLGQRSAGPGTVENADA